MAVRCSGSESIALLYLRAVQLVIPTADPAQLDDAAAGKSAPPLARSQLDNCIETISSLLPAARLSLERVRTSSVDGVARD
jgi:hypothetical protein